MIRSVTSKLTIVLMAAVLSCTLDAGSIGGSDDGGRGAISGSIVNAQTSLWIETDVAVSIRGAESHNLTAVGGSFRNRRPAAGRL
jgi:hypothetical protein